jgi:hypothetical protein
MEPIWRRRWSKCGGLEKMRPIGPADPLAAAIRPAGEKVLMR